MEAKTWAWIDKKDWGDGPWQHEPDKIQFDDEATGLPCIVRRSGMGGNLCGYVGVPEGHPWFGKNYSDLLDVEVHGGLTFAEKCQEDDKEHGICHVEDDGVKRYWLGFDCGHSQDLMPAMVVRERELGPSLNFPGFPVTVLRCSIGVYKSVEYVKQECASLARQVKEAR
jgi:hypothetical protein